MRSPRPACADPRGHADSANPGRVREHKRRFRTPLTRGRHHLPPNLQSRARTTTARGAPGRGRHRPPADADGALVRRGAAVMVALVMLLSAVLPVGENPRSSRSAGEDLRQRRDAAEAVSRSNARIGTPDGVFTPPLSLAVPPEASPLPPPEPEPSEAAEPGPDPTASQTREEETEPAAEEQQAEEGEEADDKSSNDPVAPVGGLNQQQMDHAATIVAMGRRAGLPERAYVVAIATALQESYLRNLANPQVPESYQHDHDGTGSDHDSVGLFQQRHTMGWGTVAQLMDPSYAATKFYDALRNVPGWQDMPVTAAAQAVQRSAYPDHYAKHEPLARQIVNALS